MHASTWPLRPALLAAVSAAALALGGCSMLGFGDDKPDAAVSGAVASAAPAAGAPADGEIDVRRVLGPNYCPELRIVDGAQLVRQYERGHDEDPAFVIWQASIGKTARECLYDAQGGLTLRVGVSGRVIAGPKGGATTVTVPLKIAVVKYQEAVLATQSFPIGVALPAAGSTVFSEVHDIVVPSPGTKRDYVVYVGIDVDNWDPMHPVKAEPVVAAAEEEVALPDEVIQAPPSPPPPPRSTPKELPVPSDGFVLGR